MIVIFMIWYSLRLPLRHMRLLTVQKLLFSGHDGWHEVVLKKLYAIPYNPMHVAKVP